MSGNWHQHAARFHTCEKFPHKGRFPDRGVAAAYARRSMEKNPAAPQLYTFACKACKGWHLTHKPPRGVR